MSKIIKKWAFIFMISFVTFFFIAFQTYNILNIDVHYQGEVVGLHIVPSYILLVALIPLSLILIMLLPGFIIVSVSFTWPVYNAGTIKTNLEYVFQKYISYIKISKRFKLNMVIRC